MRKQILMSITLVAALTILLSVQSKAKDTNKAMSRKTAIVILNTDTIAEMQLAKKVIEEKGGRIRNVFPPSVFIAKITQDLAGELRRIDSPYIKEVRGKGLLIGVVLTDKAGGARRFCEALQDKNILCKETHENVIRFAPPLVITKEDIDWALTRIRDVLST